MPIVNRSPIIKVCGVTRLEDLEVLADAGVDAVGFNFVPGRARAVTLKRAAELSTRAARLSLIRVAVLMNPTAQQLRELLDTVELDWIQLHGAETPSLLADCGGLPILKATSWTGRAEERELARAWSTPIDIPAYSQVSELPREGSCDDSALGAWLIDAYAPVAGGGTGKLARWDLLQPRPSELAAHPLLVAGGLTPANVGEAIRITRADGVDTASGVESSPGIKDAELVHAFAERARLALDAVRRS